MRNTSASRIPPSGIRCRTIGLIAILALLITGCSTGSSESASPSGERTPLAGLKGVTDPKAHRGPSTAVLVDRTITPVTDDAQPELPATVTSYDRDAERQVRITDTSRVVPMDISGSIAATLWGLGFGSTQVGRDIATTFPGAAKLPVVTAGANSVNSEAVIALRPSLVITDGTVGPRDVIAQLRDVGIPVVFVKNSPSFDGAASLARQVAAIYGAPDVGEELAKRIDDDVAKTTATIAKNLAPQASERKLRMVFLYLRGGAGVYYLFGKESGTDQLITALGGRDVASEMGWAGMKPMTDEAIVKANPDLILVMSRGLESVGGVAGLKESKPAIALTNAGKNDRFVDMADGDILSFGPRSALILDALARAIYAPEPAKGSGP